jgi:hypothetical protein
LGLKYTRFLPLARQFLSCRHPDCTSQNAVEEAVLAEAVGIVQRVGLPAIVIGDKGAPAQHGLGPRQMDS